MKYLLDPSEFKSPTKTREYLTAQEEHLLSCLYGSNIALKPDQIKHFVPELAKFWKYYLNIPGISSEERQIATVHCSVLVTFGRNNNGSSYYHEIVKDTEHKKVKDLEERLKRENMTNDDMLIVRDLRLI